MKKPIIFVLLPLFILGMLASCGGGGKEYSEEADASEDSMEEVTEEEAPSYSGKTAVGVVHSVENLTDWVAVYEEVSDPGGRVAYYVNVDNPEEIVVFELTTSHEEAKAVFASDELKADMERAGVSSEPSFIYYDIQYMNEESTDAMYRVGISHEVEDFDTWKEKFDADEARRQEAGLELRALATDADNPKLVHIFFSTDDLDPIKGMLTDPNMKATMEDAGVISEPAVSYWRVTEME